MYKGHEIKLMNINWTMHLDQAWQANFQVSDWKTEIAYGVSAEDAFEKIKKIVDVYSPT